MTECFKLVAVIAVKAVLGGYPNEAVPALDDVENHALGETLSGGEQLIVWIGLAVQFINAQQ